MAKDTALNKLSRAKRDSYPNKYVTLYCNGQKNPPRKRLARNGLWQHCYQRGKIQKIRRANALRAMAYGNTVLARKNSKNPPRTRLAL